MEPTISANDLSPGDRVVLRMQKSKIADPIRRKDKR
jgi:hypothetical protein